MQKVAHVQDTTAPSSQLETSLKENLSSKAPHGIHRGLCCQCLTVQLFLLPSSASSLPQRCGSQRYFAVNFLHANLYFRVCFLGSLTCENSFGPNQTIAFCYHLIILNYDDLYIRHGRLTSVIKKSQNVSGLTQQKLLLTHSIVLHSSMERGVVIQGSKLWPVFGSTLF